MEKCYVFFTRWSDFSRYNPVDSKSDIHFLPLHQVFEIHGFKNGQKEEDEEEGKSQFCHMNEKYQDTMVHIERVRQCDDVGIIICPFLSLEITRDWYNFFKTCDDYSIWACNHPYIITHTHTHKYIYIHEKLKQLGLYLKNIYMHILSISILVYVKLHLIFTYRNINIQVKNSLTHALQLPHSHTHSYTALSHTHTNLCMLICI